MARKLFGTDGIRGKADQYPLDDSTMFALGRALARDLRGNPTVLIGMDTRESGSRISDAISAGIEAEGGNVWLLGVIPTPGVAWLCRESKADAGISISASHNPWEDNGVKIFGSNGMKLADSLEMEIEKDLRELRDEGAGEKPSRTTEKPELIDRYENFLVSVIGSGTLEGMSIVADAGHGAAFRIAREVLEGCGAKVDLINAEPDGRNINEGSGALHPGALASAVVDRKADAGVAFDGDADRAILVDDEGSIRDGDEILLLWAEDLDRQDKLKNSLVVSTVMSNLGFENALKAKGIALLRAKVGDKYVLEQMIENDGVLGGEQSGHVIDLLHHTTGDGILTAISIFAIVNRSGRKFSELETFEPAPQILVNSKVSSKPPLESLDRYQAAAAKYENELGNRGRILVRYSGTENLVRVMVEGEDRDRIETIANELSEILKSEIGASEQ
ncbi:MAG: phosphoglucosamine mutase [Thermoanaerobaculia bacterium]|nr:phosphoglucosamine mutase [Thermoanaerobaculia bacterium]